MSEKKSISSNLFVILFFCFFVSVIAIFGFAMTVDYKSDSNKYTVFETWYYDTAFTEQVNLTHLYENENYSAEHPISLFTKLPSDTAIGDCLWFRVKNAAVSVYVYANNERKLLYTLGNGNDFYGAAQGTLWVNVPISDSFDGDMIEIEFSPAYDDKSCRIDNIKFGDETAIITAEIQGRLMGSLTSIIIIFTGIILIVIHIVFLKNNTVKSFDLIYLGFFAITTALWALCESSFLQFFTANTGAVHILSAMCLLLIPIPIFLFFKKDDTKWGKIVSYVVMSICTLNFCICCILHFTTDYDFHRLLTVGHISVGAGAIGVAFFGISRLAGKERTVRDIIAAAGMVILALFAMIDVLCYRSGYSVDASKYTKLGLLLYITSLAVNSLSQTVELAKKGISAQIISRLAYEDGLTGLGNRTAFDEKLHDLSDCDAIIVMLDVNNLKVVNDSMGHETGDMLLKQSSEFIKAAFDAKDTSYYRIGGDEFVVITENNFESSLQIYNESIDKLTRLCQNYNNSLQHKFNISIAAGFCDTGEASDISEAYRIADARMYENKKCMKKQAMIS